MKLASRGLPPLFPVGGGAGRSDPFGPFSSSSDYSLYGRVTPVGPAGERRIVPQQAVEKWLQQPAPSLLSLPRRARSLGRKPVFTPGVDGKSETRRLLEGFFNTLLRNLCTSQGCHSELCENPEKARHRDPFATAAFAQGDTIRLVRRVPLWEDSVVLLSAQTVNGRGRHRGRRHHHLRRRYRVLGLRSHGSGGP